MKKLQKPLLFTLALLPIAAVGGWFTGLYQFEMYDPALLQEAITQIGSKELLLVITAFQSALYAAICGFLGYILSERVGLTKPIRFAQPALGFTLLLSLAGGILFSLDYWTFGAFIPDIQESTQAGMTLSGWIASILYGGVVEEVMLRLFMMSLIAWLIQKLFFRNRKTVPEGVYIAANIAAAVLFAAGHLPATITIFGTLTPMLLIRCFLLNGGFGLMFGRLYHKHGIHYAMLSHALLHIISKTVWTIFL